MTSSKKGIALYAEVLQQYCFRLDTAFNESLFPSKRDCQRTLDSRLGGETAETTYSQAAMLIIQALDNVLAFSRLAGNEDHSFSVWGLARACLETCAVASWLIHPDDDAPTRIGKGMTWRYFGLTSRTRLVKRSQQTSLSDSTDAFEHRHLTVVARAKELGIKVLRSKKGNVTGFGEVMPNLSELTGQEFDNGRVQYSILSALTHGEPWAMMQFGLTRVGDSKVMSRTINPDHVKWVSAEILHWLYKPVAAFCELSGTGNSQIVQLFNEAATRMGIVLDGPGKASVKPDD